MAKSNRQKAADEGRRIMRYIVPFSFEEDSYVQICAALNSCAQWEGKAAGSRDSDIYRYIRHALEWQEKETSSAGSAWNYKTKKDGDNKICRLALRMDNGDFTYGSVPEAGLYIFRTGIGLFWYEIRLEDSELTAKELIEWQNRLKCLNRDADGRICHIVEENRRVQVPVEALKKEPPADKREQRVMVKGPAKQPELIRWLVKQDIPELPELIDEGIDYRLIGSVDENGEQKTVYVKRHHVRKLSLGTWVSEMLQVLGSGFQFYPGCKGTRADKKKKSKDCDSGMPEKALLYSYFAFPESSGIGSKEALLDAVWHLNNGYSRNFLQPENVEMLMYQPFKDAYWYASGEGCGCYARVNGENRHFLQDNMPHRMRTDYFILYILLLYQTYSLLHFSERIEYELSADAAVYLEASEDYSRKLQLIQTKINTFLLKSVHTSVSHVQYQNDVYNYIAEKLRIEADVKSLMAGVDFLEELQETREERQRAKKEQDEARKRQLEDDRLSIGVSILSLLTVISAFADGIGFLDNVRDDGGFVAALHQGPEYIVILAVILIVSLTAIVIFGYSVRRFWKNRRSEDENREQNTSGGGKNVE